MNQSELDGISIHAISIRLLRKIDWNVFWDELSYCSENPDQQLQKHFMSPHFVVTNKIYKSLNLLMYGFQWLEAMKHIFSNLLLMYGFQWLEAITYILMNLMDFNSCKLWPSFPSPFMLTSVLNDLPIPSTIQQSQLTWPQTDRHCMQKNPEPKPPYSPVHILPDICPTQVYEYIHG